MPVAPFAEDTEGGGKFVNRADGFITLHQKVQAQENGVTAGQWRCTSARRILRQVVRRTPHDFPLRFEFSKQQSGFQFMSPGPRLFTPLYVN